jgi:glycosyltransferase involved in cell wall biosynthesis/5'(3')-deoxyribonucleotidase
VESGASVRVGDLQTLLHDIRDVFCVICNTIMTAGTVVDLANGVYPVVWILHEWWDDEMIVKELRMRNYQDLTLATVKVALERASLVVFVCESQRQLYNPKAPSTVIFVGVPDPLPRYITSSRTETLESLGQKNTDKAGTSWTKDPNVFTFLCLGIICPRKNQLWTVQLFKEFAKDKPNARLKIVGARYTRTYETDYLDLLKKEIGDDPRVEVLDVTDNVDPYYQIADAVILTSLNEVTPMVISEALSWSIPVLSTNIAGIGEMYTDGKEGFLFAPGDTKKALSGMEAIYSDVKLRQKMSVKARARFETTFDLNVMVEHYKQLMFKVAPPVILLDMDGVLVDWDRGFLQAWGPRCPIDRTTSYYMEDCLMDMTLRKEALQLIAQPGFFENLAPMQGALEAVKEMEEEGWQLYICSAPIKHSPHCAQEKINWITKHLGEEWVDRIILCQDKVSCCLECLISSLVSL